LPSLVAPCIGALASGRMSAGAVRERRSRVRSATSTPTFLPTSACWPAPRRPDGPPSPMLVPARLGGRRHSHGNGTGMTAGGYGTAWPSDADRANVQAILNRAYAEGRLSQPDFQARAAQVAGAETYDTL